MPAGPEANVRRRGRPSVAIDLSPPTPWSSRCGQASWRDCALVPKSAFWSVTWVPAPCSLVMAVPAARKAHGSAGSLMSPWRKGPISCSRLLCSRNGHRVVGRSAAQITRHLLPTLLCGPWQVDLLWVWVLPTVSRRRGLCRSHPKGRESHPSCRCRP